MAEYKHGTMDTTTHERTFAGFVRFVGIAVVVIVVILILIGLLNG